MTHNMKPTQSTARRKTHVAKTNKPTLPRGFPDKPLGLPPEVDEFWSYYAKTLRDNCLPRQHDVSGILRLAQATALLNALNREIKEKGIAIDPKSGKLRHAALFDARKRAFYAEFKLLNEFLLTPVARWRAGVGKIPAWFTSTGGVSQ